MKATSELGFEHKLIFEFVIIGGLFIFALIGCSGGEESFTPRDVISSSNDIPSDVFPAETEPLLLGEVRVISESFDGCKKYSRGEEVEVSEVVDDTLDEVEVYGDKCIEVEVTCAGLQDSSRVLLQIGEPNAKAKGTILFATGNGGGGYWGNSELARGILESVRAEGFRTIEMDWKDGWLLGSEENKKGLGKLACRPATLYRWIYDNPDLSSWLLL